ncbi:MAG: hypothetical protein EOO38_23205 [Cytophagaceae bacterium]|nr:MAG: hypothetical protein EOO38_23205 [Cytophagaceae bacterium]
MESHKNGPFQLYVRPIWRHQQRYGWAPEVAYGVKIHLGQDQKCGAPKDQWITVFHELIGRAKGFSVAQGAP